MYRRGFREDHDDNIPLNEQPVSPTAVHFGAGDIGWTAFGPAVGLSVLATVIVTLRWYTRARLVRIIGLDDWVILISLLFCWVITASIGAAIFAGIGEYRTKPGVVDTILIVKLLVVVNTVWATTVNITKASILIQYLRVFNGCIIRACCWTLMAALLPATCWAVFGGIFLCTPTAKLWNVTLPGHCRNAQVYWASVAGVNIGLDFLTLILPIPVIGSLHLPRKQKILTMLVFVLGFIVCAVSCVRLGTVIVTAEMGDPVMSGIWAITWSAVEANVGVICASLLALKAFIIKLFPKLMEEPQLPRHQMRLPEVASASAEPIWNAGDSDVPTLGGSDRSLAASWPPTPSSRFSAAHLVYKMRVESVPEHQQVETTANEVLVREDTVGFAEFLRHDSRATDRDG
ncbi:Wortmanamides biosynthesis cluster protein C [Fulvia fulva]|nr:Wortmanamides biosynthesis cluster protein C [Fulvia fulva]WPV15678.1 Wortmanamides biosynthesis cluster protein C [Fulvia fulva]WPV31445.1 Wortmanamides biosynthesis cluster protein C [Fulvia fulva]